MSFSYERFSLNGTDKLVSKIIRYKKRYFVNYLIKIDSQYPQAKLNIQQIVSSKLPGSKISRKIGIFRKPLNGNKYSILVFQHLYEICGGLFIVMDSRIKV